MATVLVTGANRGIGLEFCRQLVARGDHVVGAGRKSSPELEALGVQVETLDVSDPPSVAAFAARLSDVQWDMVICNAGLLTRETLGEIDYAAIQRQFDVNTLGPLRVVEALAPQMAPTGKVAIVTSRMGSVEDNTSGGMYGYRISKAAANMVGRSLAHDLRTQGVAVCLLHPGHVRTDMTGGRGHVEPDEAAAGLLKRIDELTLQESGTFWHASGEPLPW